jgi:hypothetical protein
MLDIKYIRENAAKVKENVLKRGVDSSKADTDKLLKIDNEKNLLQKKIEELRQKRNVLSKSKPTKEQIEEAKSFKTQIEELEDSYNKLNKEFTDIMLWFPNLSSEEMPEGKTSEDNIEVKAWRPDMGYLKPEEIGKGEFSGQFMPDYVLLSDSKFDLKDHVELGKIHKIIDVEQSAKVSGSRFTYLLGDAVRLQWALANHLNEKLLTEGWVPMVPPLMVKERSLYGTVKGEIVKFTTKSSKVTYVQPVAPTKVTGKTSTKTSVKNEIVCSDGSVVTVGSRGTATLINEGQKLISLHVEKVSGSLSPNSEATYRLVYKNLSDTRIAPLTFKVSVPSDMSFVNSTAGMFDANARTLTVSGVGLDPYAEGSLTWNVQVNNGALVGTSVVTTAYVIYTVPGTSGNETVQDEVTSYVVGTITEQTDSKSEGGKKVIGKSGDGIGFLPNTLIEWLALIAILFIIGILGRSLYVAYKGDNNNNHH